MASNPYSPPDAGETSPAPRPPPPPVRVLPPPEPESADAVVFKPGYRLSATGRVGGKASGDEPPTPGRASDGEETSDQEPETSGRLRMVAPPIPGAWFLVLSFVAGLAAGMLGMLILQPSRTPAPTVAETAPPLAPNTPVVDAAGAHIPIHSPPLDFAFLPRIPAGSQIVASWIAEDVGPAMPKDATMHSVVMKVLDPLTRLTFTIRPPEDGWPVGKYRLEIRHEEKLLRQDRFVVP